MDNARQVVPSINWNQFKHRIIFFYASIFGIYKCDSDFEVDQAAAMWPFANLLVNLRYFIRSIALFFSVFFSFPSPSSFPHVSSVPLFLCVCVCVCELMIFQTFSGWVKRAVLETSAAFLSPGRYSSSGRRHSFHAQSFGLTMASNRNGNRCHSLPPPPPPASLQTLPALVCDAHNFNHQRSYELEIKFILSHLHVLSRFIGHALRNQ